MAAGSEPLTLQAKIPLGDVKGRIDHLAIDHARQRLFVAELGNNSLSIVDLKGRSFAPHPRPRRASRRCLPLSLDYIYVSNGGRLTSNFQWR